jgi:restriction endonuclease
MIRVIATGPNQRGDLFTDLMKDLVTALGFEPVRVNIHKSGREIDIQARHRYEARQAIVECKARDAKVGGDEINKFVGVLDAERRSSRLDTVGYFISLSGFKDSALEQESVLNEQRCVLMDGEAIHSALAKANIIVDASTARVRAAEICEMPGWTPGRECDLLATDYGWVWRIFYIVDREIVGHTLIHADGQPLHKSASEDLGSRIPDGRHGRPTRSGATSKPGPDRRLEQVLPREYSHMATDDNHADSQFSATRHANGVSLLGGTLVNGGADRTAAAGQATPARTGRRRPNTTLAIRRIALAAAGGAAVLAIGLLWLTGTLSRAGDGSPQTPPGPRSIDSSTPSPQPTPECDRYEVAARELSLRDETGSTTGEDVPRGQQLTILDRRSESGPPSIWLATTDDGVTGWVDYNYLRPVCLAG